jgi:hypothetical protein
MMGESGEDGLSLLVGTISFLLDDIDRDLHCRNLSPVLKPVCGIPILWPAHAWPIVRSDSVPMVGDRSLQDVDGARSVFVVVNRAKTAAVAQHGPACQAGWRFGAASAMTGTVGAAASGLFSSAAVVAAMPDGLSTCGSTRQQQGFLGRLLALAAQFHGISGVKTAIALQVKDLDC